MGTHPLYRHSWYHGSITRDEAEYRLWLAGPNDGCWLVRSSQSLDQRLCLSLWSAPASRFFHIIIPVNRNGGFYLDSPAMGFASMEDLLFFYTETKKSFTTHTGDTVQLLSSCNRPQVVAPTPEDDYCSTLASTPPMLAKCGIAVSTAPIAPVPSIPPAAMVKTATAPSFTASSMANLEAALQHPQVLEWAAEQSGWQEVSYEDSSSSGDGDIEVEALRCTGRSNPAPRNDATLRRRTRRQSSLQRHNATDGLPIMLRKSTDEEKAKKKEAGLLRKFSHSLLNLLRILLLLGPPPKATSTAGAGPESLPREPRARKRDAHKDKRKKGDSADLPTGSEVIDVSNHRRRNHRHDKHTPAEMPRPPPKPILYADEVADIVQAIHEKRRQSEVAAAIAMTNATTPRSAVTTV